MAKAKTVSTHTFNDAFEMSDEIVAVMKAHNSPIMYVEDEDGNTYTSFRVTEHTLSDGSKVFNMVLVPSE